MKNIMFLCTGNSCRSQMAEGFCRKYWGHEFNVYSAGTKKHGMNDRAIKVMKEVGVDISSHFSKTVEELPNINFDYVITVCDSAHENCPYFPEGKVIHVGFQDPPALTKDMNDEEEILNVYRRVRDEIHSSIKNLPRKFEASLQIEEINPNTETKITKDHLLFYYQKYDLSPFIYTKIIHINSDGSSQSHPILTLSTKSYHYPERILSTFLHEQFHWWASAANEDDFRNAILDLKVLYPELPDVGIASSAFSTYLHLIICWLEFKSIAKLIGRNKAEEVILSYINEAKIYEWIYEQILQNQDEIERILKNRNLIPQGI